MVIRYAVDEGLVGKLKGPIGIVEAATLLAQLGPEAAESHLEPWL